MRRSEIFLSVVVLLGAFAAGLAWAPAVGSDHPIKEVLEVFSYLATILAAVSAILALSSWRESTRHSERFNALKVLKQRAAELKIYRAFLFAFQTQQIYLISNAWQRDPGIDKDVDQTRDEWVSAFDRYLISWETASIFLDPLEVRSIEIHHDVLRSIAHVIPLQITGSITSDTPNDAISFFHLTRSQIDRAAEAYVETNKLVHAALRSAR